MITIKVMPLAQHYIEKHELTDEIREKIAAHSEKHYHNAKVLWKDRNGDDTVIIALKVRNANPEADKIEYHIEAEFQTKAYSYDERRVIFNRSHFPVSMEIAWKQAIENGEMFADRLIDMALFAKRRVKDYNRSATGMITMFTLEEPNESEIVEMGDKRPGETI